MSQVDNSPKAYKIPYYDEAALMARIEARKAGGEPNTETRAGRSLTVSTSVRLIRFFNRMIDTMRPAKKQFEMTVEKPAKRVESSAQAEIAPQAPSVDAQKSEASSVETSKIKVSYDASELDAPAYKRFLKKNFTAIKAHHAKNLAGFPKEMAKEYDDSVKGFFKTEYVSARRRGNSVESAFIWANKMANGFAGQRFMDDENPVYAGYGLAMVQCELKTVATENSVSITYTRKTKIPVELPPKPAKAAKPAKQNTQTKKPSRSISSLLFSREKSSARSLLNRLTGHHYASVDLTKMDDVVPTGENSNDGVLLHTYTRTSRD